MDRYRGGESDTYDRRLPPSSSSSEPPGRNPNFRPGFSTSAGGRSTNFHSPPHHHPSSNHTHGGGGGGRSNNFHSPPPCNRGGGGGRRSNFHSPPPSNHGQGGGGGDGVSGFGGGARSSNFHSPPPSNDSHGGGGGSGSGFSSGAEFRPTGAAAGSFNGGGSHGMPISGQKRGFPFYARGGSPPENTDGAAFAKLFIGSVPRTATEEEIRPLFEEHGDVIEVALIKDKRTGQQQGPLGLKGATLSSYVTAVRFCTDIQGFSLLVTHLSFMSLSRRMQDHANLLKTGYVGIWKRDKMNPALLPLTSAVIFHWH